MLYGIVWHLSGDKLEPRIAVVKICKARFEDTHKRSTCAYQGAYKQSKYPADAPKSTWQRITADDTAFLQKNICISSVSCQTESQQSLLPLDVVVGLELTRLKRDRAVKKSLNIKCLAQTEILVKSAQMCDRHKATKINLLHALMQSLHPNNLLLSLL